MTEWAVYRAPATGDPGPALARVRARDRYEAQEKAEARFPDLRVSVSPVSADRRVLRRYAPARVAYQSTREGR